MNFDPGTKPIGSPGGLAAVATATSGCGPVRSDDEGTVAQAVSGVPTLNSMQRRCIVSAAHNRNAA